MKKAIVNENHREHDLMTQCVTLNKWTQRLMYTLQTEALGLDDELLDKQIHALRKASTLIAKACRIQDSNRKFPE